MDKKKQKRATYEVSGTTKPMVDCHCLECTGVYVPVGRHVCVGRFALGKPMLWESRGVPTDIQTEGLKKIQSWVSIKPFLRLKEIDRPQDLLSWDVAAERCVRGSWPEERVASGASK